MCEPLTIAAMTATALGTIQKAQAEKAAGDASAAILEGNAHIAEMAAGDAVQRGQALEGRARLQGSMVASKQASAYAASGVVANTGSAADVQASTAGLSELDAQIIRNNAAREAWGYKTQAGNMRTQARLARSAGSSRMIGTILGGIAGAATMGYPLLSIGGPATDVYGLADAEDVPGMLGET